VIREGSGLGARRRVFGAFSRANKTHPRFGSPTWQLSDRVPVRDNAITVRELNQKVTWAWSAPGREHPARIAVSCRQGLSDSPVVCHVRRHAALRVGNEWHGSASTSR
jgi:hypothetical protein